MTDQHRIRGSQTVGVKDAAIDSTTDTMRSMSAQELGGVDNFLFARDPTRASFISASTLAAQEDMMGVVRTDDSRSSQSSLGFAVQQEEPQPEQQQRFDFIETESPTGRLMVASTLLNNQGVCHLATYLQSSRYSTSHLPSVVTETQQHNTSTVSSTRRLPVHTQPAASSRRRKFIENTEASTQLRAKRPSMGLDSIRDEEEKLLNNLLGLVSPGSSSRQPPDDSSSLDSDMPGLLYNDVDM